MRTRVPHAARNILRFPVERRARPSLVLLRELAPDVREVLATIDAFALAGPLPDLRERTDAEMARHIAAATHDGIPLSFEALDRLVNPLVVVAIAACWAARDGSTAAAEAQRDLMEARVGGREGLGHLRARVSELQRRMADLLVAAYARTEVAEGVARAVDFAQRGELWSALGAYVEAVAVAARQPPKPISRSPRGPGVTRRR